LALPERLLRALALGDVEHGRLDGGLAGPDDLGDLDLDPDLRAVTPRRLQLVLRPDRLAPPPRRPVALAPRAMVGRGPAAGIEADELVGVVVAEHARERRVDEQGDPVALDVDALDRALDQRAVAPLALALAREELRVPDGHGRLVGEPQQGGLVAVTEGALRAIGHVEQRSEERRVGREW